MVSLGVVSSLVSCLVSAQRANQSGFPAGIISVLIPQMALTRLSFFVSACLGFDICLTNFRSYGDEGVLIVYIHIMCLLVADINGSFV